MIWQIILGSSLVATLVTIFSEWGVQWWRKREEQNQNLYGPVKFYLMLLENIDQNRDSLFDEMRKGTHEIEFNDSDARNNWQSETNQQLAMMGKPIVEEMLNHIERLKSIFESNPELIKNKHKKAVINFFDGIMKRKILIAGGHPQKFLHLSEQAYKDWQDAIFNAIKVLRKEICH